MVMLPVIEIIVNGEVRTSARGLTVAGLLGELGLAHRAISVRRNGQNIPPADYDRVRLSSGDQLSVAAGDS